MSWFKRESTLRSSFGRKSPSKSKPPDPDACFESFKKHCQQACSIINKNCLDENDITNTGAPPTVDDVTIALSNLDQMVTLLIQENKMVSQNSGLQIGPMLDYLMTDGILDKLYLWSFRTGEFCNAMKLEQLKIYEVLLSHSAHELLVHKPILRPLLKLLASCKDCAPVEVEKRLIVLLNQLCVSFTQNTNLLEYFFSASSEHGSARFLIFSLLIPFVHREGGIGQQARDALLLCMSLSHTNDNIGKYIADFSNFCPVLATGLSGLYSLLPRKLDIKSEDWCFISNDDIQEIPELLMFMNSLEFCNAVIQVSHLKVQEQLLDYLYQGFLIPVLGPALHQSSIEEIETATVYLDLFIRTVTDPALIHSFLKFILTEEFDAEIVINTLVSRLNSHPRLSLITMALFNTLLDLNCEDFMLELIFKYLVPCNHVMVSQKCRLRDSDIYSLTTAKLLALIPNCCHEQPNHVSTPSHHQVIPTSQSDYSLSSTFPASSKVRSGPSLNLSSYANHDPEHFALKSSKPKNEMYTGYLKYLNDAHWSIKRCMIASQSWSGKYDGISPVDAKCAKYSESKIHSNSVSNIPRNNSIPILENGFVNGTTCEQTLKQNLNDAGGNISSDSCCSGEPDFWTVVSSCKVDTLHDLENSVDKLFLLIQGKQVMLTVNSKEKVHRRFTITSPRECDYKFADAQRNRTVSCPVDKVSNFSIRLSREGSSSFGSPDIGPFLGIILTKLENMMNNSIYVNLQLTGLFVRLAIYPQPLLKSFLLSHNLVFQPTVRSLIQILGSLKHKLDTFSYTQSSFQDMLARARQFLVAREEKHNQESSSGHKPPNLEHMRAKSNSIATSDHNRPEGRRRSFSNFLFRRGAALDDRNPGTIRESPLESIPDNQGYRYINKCSSDAPEGRLEWLKTKNAVLCAIVLEEFVKELAAISQEHLIADSNNIDFTSIL